MLEAEFEFDTREFERAMTAISRESDRSDFQIITANADTLLKAMAYNTPRQTGNLRNGYMPAWDALDKAGTPGSRRAYAPFTRKQDKENLKARPWLKRLYVPDGRVDDSRSVRGEKYFEFVNKSHYITTSNRRIFYGYILNSRKNFVGKALREAAFKFGRAYEKMLKRHSKI